jgi:hypothetical protein
MKCKIKNCNFNVLSGELDIAGGSLRDSVIAWGSSSSAAVRCYSDTVEIINNQLGIADIVSASGAFTGPIDITGNVCKSISSDVDYEGGNIVNSLWVTTNSGGGVAAHHATHEDGGTDEIDVDDLSGKLADDQKAGWIHDAAIDALPAAEAIDNKIIVGYLDGSTQKFKFLDLLKTNYNLKAVLPADAVGSAGYFNSLNSKPLTNNTDNFDSGNICPDFLSDSNVKINNITVIAPAAAVTQATVGTDPTLRVDLYNHTYNARSLLKTVRLTPADDSLVNTANNLTSGGNLIFRKSLDYIIAKDSLLGLEFVAEPDDNTHINALAAGSILSVDGEETEENAGLTFYTDQSTADNIKFTINIPTGESVIFDWGDGNSTTASGTGSNQDVTHSYSGSSTYVINITGDLVNLSYFRCNNTSVSGEVSQFKILTSLTTLSLYYTKISGELTDLSSLINLTYLSLSGTLITGNLTGVSTLSTLKYLNLSGTSLADNVSKLNALTSLTYLNLGNTSVSGNVSGLSTLTNLTYLSLNATSVSVTTDSLAAWSGISFNIVNCNLTSTEVDNLIIKLNDAGGSNGTLTANGNNAARTSASDSARTALINRGWTVTTN